MKNNWKYYVDVIKETTGKLLTIEKKKLRQMGAIVLAIIVTASGILVLFKIKGNHPKVNNKPAEIVQIKDNNNDKMKLFLENVEQLKSGIYSVSTLVFGEENMRINETFGESAKNYVVMQGNFKVKYSVDITRIRFDYDFDNEKLILNVPKDSIGVDSVEIMGDLVQLEKHETWLHKLAELIPGFNDDEELKENAIRQLLRNSKIEANKYNANELQTKADKALKELIDTININELKYEIKFVENNKINIKK